MKEQICSSTRRLTKRSVSHGEFSNHQDQHAEETGYRNHRRCDLCVYVSVDHVHATLIGFVHAVRDHVRTVHCTCLLIMYMLH